MMGKLENMTYSTNPSLQVHELWVKCTGCWYSTYLPAKKSKSNSRICCWLMFIYHLKKCCLIRLLIMKDIICLCPPNTKHFCK